MNVKMIKRGDNDCTGCGACVAVCSAHAIQMKMVDGFEYPYIQEELCTHCGVCEQVCSVSGELCKQESYEPSVAYAVKNKSDHVRYHSTSGGVFSALAESVLTENGAVAGAAYTPEWTVKHHVIKDVEDLELLRRSKYMQSSTQDVYKEIEKCMSDGRKVLVCGTPCQIAGIRSFFSKEQQRNLVCVDFVCRGVSSPLLFQKYLQVLEEQAGAETIDVWFKHKANGWHNLNTRITFANKQIYEKPGIEDVYVQIYLTYNCGMRESCYNCKFKDDNSMADLTLGDFWGVDESVLQDDLGVSLVICRNEKGKTLLQKCRGRLDIQRRSRAEAIAGNPCLKQSVLDPGDEKRREFMKRLQRQGFLAAYDYAKGEEQ